ncbi:Hypothetical protein LUCI_0817 [Lucifera butyrica]|uniref:Uncharacterized protein n=1 Tax=Lucifera butyrica TaxID=1351585 RepID=A0A498R434_9FIRM|nr:hypothetical protein [Lucifera butyrica]VBB05607.1 Hypothetical protein LUCI_0817 [Lucifera butyrica]
MAEIRPVDERVDQVKIIEVIQVVVCKGQGTQESPGRRVEKFFKTDGTFIGQIDPCERANREPKKQLSPQLFQQESNAIKRE